MSYLLECEGLSKSFVDKKALDNVSFKLKAGSPIALIGPNGAGKTTLFSIICGYFKQSSGSICLMGQEPGANHLFGKVSALPQDAQLSPDASISKQFCFYAQLQGLSKADAKSEVKRVLGLLGLLDAESKRPSELSHGMRKRACIAQALMGKPELVLLDEPTAGLDPVNAKIIRQQILSLGSEATFIISSHNLQELERICQRVLYLSHGQLTEISELDNDVDSHESFLTIIVPVDSAVESEALFNSVSRIESVVQSQPGEFLLQYNGVENFDIELLKLLQVNNIQYRQLINGKTLEARLF